MKALSALVAGVLFGLGLLISGMTNPANVLAFLDIAGDWNPALAFTMAGAVASAAPAFLYARRRRRTLLGEPQELPERARVDGRLLTGAAIFGVGWGMSGICPGPALVLLAGGTKQALVFAASLGMGMLASHLIERVPAHVRGSRSRFAGQDGSIKTARKVRG